MGYVFLHVHQFSLTGPHLNRRSRFPSALHGVFRPQLFRQAKQFLSRRRLRRLEPRQFLRRELCHVQARVFVGEGSPRSLDARRVRVPRLAQAHRLVSGMRAQVVHPLADRLVVVRRHRNLFPPPVHCEQSEVQVTEGTCSCIIRLLGRVMYVCISVVSKGRC